MEEVEVLEELFDKKIISILKVLYQETEKQFYLQELSQLSKTPMATSLRILQKLYKLEIVDISKVSRIKLYKIADNKKTKFLSKLFKVDLRIIDKFVDAIKVIPNLDSIILHGKEHPDRANVLLIGDNLDPGKIKEACATIKEKYKFNINSLSLTEQQYEQMSQMGLYSGVKKVIFKK